MLLLIGQRGCGKTYSTTFQYIHVTINLGLTLKKSPQSFCFNTSMLLLICNCSGRSTNRSTCFNTSMLLLIQSQIVNGVYSGLCFNTSMLLLIQYSTVAGITASLFQYIHVTINQIVLATLCQPIIVSIHPCYY